MNNQTLNEINKRDSDKCYFSLSFSYSTIYFNDGNDYIYQRKVYTLIGCNIFGVRKYITSIFEDDFEKASDWYNFFQTLNSRGLESVIFSVLPNVDFIRKAIKLSFPETTVFTSCFDIIDRLFKFFSQSYSCNIYESIKHIFLAKDVNEFNLKINEFYTDFQVQPFTPNKEIALLNRDEFNEKYKNKNTIYKHANEYFELILPLFDLPQNIRKYIYTNNIIESVNSKIQRGFYGRGALPNKESAVNIIYLNLIDLENKWKKSKVPNWDKINNELTTLYYNEIKEYLN